ncbi:FATC domain-containing protein [Toxoplasma gondii ME49]|uniref:non-specific serine/threonine protein kinase n=1 Tax=Toxoplasma gondii (strain ATCC 50611 / Me49) TaxID=508771 RepID=S8F559_TOXGM|nr:FATC domain-containing protein [Toxoplasma gondii ME49]EPT30946.1 FATC domain-containing protein [Toxoplasma gondii ME49]|eukprot:XP_018637747.1 FATC domain-containing protein [Toxoplasma gondii ME49]
MTLCLVCFAGHAGLCARALRRVAEVAVLLLSLLGPLLPVAVSPSATAASTFSLGADAQRSGDRTRIGNCFSPRLLWLAKEDWAAALLACMHVLDNYLGQGGDEGSRHEGAAGGPRAVDFATFVSETVEGLAFLAASPLPSSLQSDQPSLSLFPRTLWSLSFADKRASKHPSSGFFSLPFASSFSPFSLSGGFPGPSATSSHQCPTGRRVVHPVALSLFQQLLVQLLSVNWSPVVDYHVSVQRLLRLSSLRQSSGLLSSSALPGSLSSFSSLSSSHPSEHCFSHLPSPLPNFERQQDVQRTLRMPLDTLAGLTCSHRDRWEAAAPVEDSSSPHVPISSLRLSSFSPPASPGETHLVSSLAGVCAAFAGKGCDTENEASMHLCGIAIEGALGTLDAIASRMNAHGRSRVLTPSTSSKSASFGALQTRKRRRLTGRGGDGHPRPEEAGERARKGEEGQGDYEEAGASETDSEGNLEDECRLLYSWLMLVLQFAGDSKEVETSSGEEGDADASPAVTARWAVASHTVRQGCARRLKTLLLSLHRTFFLPARTLAPSPRSESQATGRGSAEEDSEARGNSERLTNAGDTELAPASEPARWIPYDASRRNTGEITSRAEAPRRTTRVAEPFWVIPSVFAPLLPSVARLLSVYFLLDLRPEEETVLHFLDLWTSARCAIHATGAEPNWTVPRVLPGVLRLLLNAAADPALRAEVLLATPLLLLGREKELSEDTRERETDEPKLEDEAQGEAARRGRPARQHGGERGSSLSVIGALRCEGTNIDHCEALLRGALRLSTEDQRLSFNRLLHHRIDSLYASSCAVSPASGRSSSGRSALEIVSFKAALIALAARLLPQPLRCIQGEEAVNASVRGAEIIAEECRPGEAQISATNDNGWEEPLGRKLAFSLLCSTARLLSAQERSSPCGRDQVEARVACALSSLPSPVLSRLLTAWQQSLSGVSRLTSRAAFLDDSASFEHAFWLPRKPSVAESKGVLRDGLIPKESSSEFSELLRRQLITEIYHFLRSPKTSLATLRKENTLATVSHALLEREEHGFAASASAVQDARRRFGACDSEGAEDPEETRRNSEFSKRPDGVSPFLCFASLTGNNKEESANLSDEEGGKEESKRSRHSSASLSSTGSCSEHLERIKLLLHAVAQDDASTLENRLEFLLWEVFPATVARAADSSSPCSFESSSSSLSSGVRASPSPRKKLDAFDGMRTRVAKHGEEPSRYRSASDEAGQQAGFETEGESSPQMASLLQFCVISAIGWVLTKLGVRNEEATINAEGGSDKKGSVGRGRKGKGDRDQSVSRRLSNALARFLSLVATSHAEPSALTLSLSLLFPFFLLFTSGGAQQAASSRVSSRLPTSQSAAPSVEPALDSTASGNASDSRFLMPRREVEALFLLRGNAILRHDGTTTTPQELSPPPFSYGLWLSLLAGQRDKARRRDSSSFCVGTGGKPTSHRAATETDRGDGMHAGERRRFQLCFSPSNTPAGLPLLCPCCQDLFGNPTASVGSLSPDMFVVSAPASSATPASFALLPPHTVAPHLPLLPAMGGPSNTSHLAHARTLESSSSCSPVSPLLPTSLPSRLLDAPDLCCTKCRVAIPPPPPALFFAPVEEKAHASSSSSSSSSGFPLPSSLSPHGFCFNALPLEGPCLASAVSLLCALVTSLLRLPPSHPVYCSPLLHALPGSSPPEVEPRFSPFLPFPAEKWTLASESETGKSSRSESESTVSWDSRISKARAPRPRPLLGSRQWIVEREREQDAIATALLPLLILSSKDVTPQRSPPSSLHVSPSREHSLVPRPSPRCGPKLRDAPGDKDKSAPRCFDSTCGRIKESLGFRLLHLLRLSVRSVSFSALPSLFPSISSLAVSPQTLSPDASSGSASPSEGKETQRGGLTAPDRSGVETNTEAKRSPRAGGSQSTDSWPWLLPDEDSFTRILAASPSRKLLLSAVHSDSFLVSLLLPLVVPPPSTLLPSLSSSSASQAPSRLACAASPARLCDGKQRPQGDALHFRSCWEPAAPSHRLARTLCSAIQEALPHLRVSLMVGASLSRLLDALSLVPASPDRAREEFQDDPEGQETDTDESEEDESDEGDDVICISCCQGVCERFRHARMHAQERDEGTASFISCASSSSPSSSSVATSSPLFAWSPDSLLSLLSFLSSCVSSLPCFSAAVSSEPSSSSWPSSESSSAPFSSPFSRHTKHGPGNSSLPSFPRLYSPSLLVLADALQQRGAPQTHAFCSFSSLFSSPSSTPVFSPSSSLVSSPCSPPGASPVDFFRHGEAARALVLTSLYICQRQSRPIPLTSTSSPLCLQSLLLSPLAFASPSPSYAELLCEAHDPRDAARIQCCNDGLVSVSNSSSMFGSTTSLRFARAALSRHLLRPALALLYLAGCRSSKIDRDISDFSMFPSSSSVSRLPKPAAAPSTGGGSCEPQNPGASLSSDALACGRSLAFALHLLSSMCHHVGLGASPSAVLPQGDEDACRGPPEGSAIEALFSLFFSPEISRSTARWGSVIRGAHTPSSFARLPSPQVSPGGVPTPFWRRCCLLLLLGPATYTRILQARRRRRTPYSPFFASSSGSWNGANRTASPRCPAPGSALLHAASPVYALANSVAEEAEDQLLSRALLPCFLLHSDFNLRTLQETTGLYAGSAFDWSHAVCGLVLLFLSDAPGPLVKGRSQYEAPASTLERGARENERVRGDAEASNTPTDLHYLSGVAVVFTALFQLAVEGQIVKRDTEIVDGALRGLAGDAATAEHSAQPRAGAHAGGSLEAAEESNAKATVDLFNEKDDRRSDSEERHLGREEPARVNAGSSTADEPRVRFSVGKPQEDSEGKRCLKRNKSLFAACDRLLLLTLARLLWSLSSQGLPGEATVNVEKAETETNKQCRPASKSARSVDRSSCKSDPSRSVSELQSQTELEAWTAGKLAWLQTSFSLLLHARERLFGSFKGVQKMPKQVDEDGERDTKRKKGNDQKDAAFDGTQKAFSFSASQSSGEDDSQPLLVITDDEEETQMKFGSKSVGKKRWQPALKSQEQSGRHTSRNEKSHTIRLSSGRQPSPHDGSLGAQRDDCDANGRAMREEAPDASTGLADFVTCHLLELEELLLHCLFPSFPLPPATRQYLSNYLFLLSEPRDLPQFFVSFLLRSPPAGALDSIARASAAEGCAASAEEDTSTKKQPCLGTSTPFSSSGLSSGGSLWGEQERRRREAKLEEALTVCLNKPRGLKALFLCISCAHRGLLGTHAARLIDSLRHAFEQCKRQVEVEASRITDLSLAGVACASPSALGTASRSAASLFSASHLGSPAPSVDPCMRAHHEVCQTFLGALRLLFVSFSPSTLLFYTPFFLHTLSEFFEERQSAVFSPGDCTADEGTRKMLPGKDRPNAPHVRARPATTDAGDAQDNACSSGYLETLEPKALTQDSASSFEKWKTQETRSLLLLLIRQASQAVGEDGELPPSALFAALACTPVFPLVLDSDAGELPRGRVGGLARDPDQADAAERMYHTRPEQESDKKDENDFQAIFDSADGLPEMPRLSLSSKAPSLGRMDPSTPSSLLPLFSLLPSFLFCPEVSSSSPAYVPPSPSSRLPTASLRSADRRRFMQASSETAEDVCRMRRCRRFLSFQRQHPLEVLALRLTSIAAFLDDLHPYLTRLSAALLLKKFLLAYGTVLTRLVHAANESYGTRAGAAWACAVHGQNEDTSEVRRRLDGERASLYLLSKVAETCEAVVAEFSDDYSMEPKALPVACVTLLGFLLPLVDLRSSPLSPPRAAPSSSPLAAPRDEHKSLSVSAAAVALLLCSSAASTANSPFPASPPSLVSPLAPQAAVAAPASTSGGGGPPHTSAGDCAWRIVDEARLCCELLERVLISHLQRPVAARSVQEILRQLGFHIHSEPGRLQVMFPSLVAMFRREKKPTALPTSSPSSSVPPPVDTVQASPSLSNPFTPAALTALLRFPLHLLSPAFPSSLSSLNEEAALREYLWRQVFPPQVRTALLPYCFTSYERTSASSPASFASPRSSASSGASAPRRPAPAGLPVFVTWLLHQLQMQQVTLEASERRHAKVEPEVGAGESKERNSESSLRLLPNGHKTRRHKRKPRGTQRSSQQRSSSASASSASSSSRGTEQEVIVLSSSASSSDEGPPPGRKRDREPVSSSTPLRRSALRLSIFRACDVVLLQLPKVLSFLLPHMVDSFLSSSSDPVMAAEDLGRRIASLLRSSLEGGSCSDCAGDTKGAQPHKEPGGAGRKSTRCERLGSDDEQEQGRRYPRSRTSDVERSDSHATFQKLQSWRAWIVSHALPRLASRLRPLAEELKSLQSASSSSASPASASPSSLSALMSSASEGRGTGERDGEKGGPSQKTEDTRRQRIILLSRSIQRYRAQEQRQKCLLQALGRLLESVDRILLARAAASCEAFARALYWIEAEMAANVFSSLYRRTSLGVVGLPSAVFASFSSLSPASSPKAESHQGNSPGSSVAAASDEDLFCSSVPLLLTIFRGLHASDALVGLLETCKCLSSVGVTGRKHPVALSSSPVSSSSHSSLSSSPSASSLSSLSSSTSGPLKERGFGRGRDGASGKQAGSGRRKMHHAEGGHNEAEKNSKVGYNRNESRHEVQGLRGEMVTIENGDEGALSSTTEEDTDVDDILDICERETGGDNAHLSMRAIEKEFQQQWTEAATLYLQGCVTHAGLKCSSGVWPSLSRLLFSLEASSQTEALPGLTKGRREPTRHSLQLAALPPASLSSEFLADAATACWSLGQWNDLSLVLASAAPPASPVSSSPRVADRGGRPSSPPDAGESWLSLQHAQLLALVHQAFQTNRFRHPESHPNPVIDKAERAKRTSQRRSETHDGRSFNSVSRLQLPHLSTDGTEPFPSVGARPVRAPGAPNQPPERGLCAFLAQAASVHVRAIRGVSRPLGAALRESPERAAPLLRSLAALSDLSFVLQNVGCPLFLASDPSTPTVQGLAHVNWESLKVSPLCDPPVSSCLEEPFDAESRARISPFSRWPASPPSTSLRLPPSLYDQLSVASLLLQRSALSFHLNAPSDALSPAVCGSHSASFAAFHAVLGAGKVALEQTHQLVAAACVGVTLRQRARELRAPSLQVPGLLQFSSDDTLRVIGQANALLRRRRKSRRALEGEGGGEGDQPAAREESETATGVVRELVYRMKVEGALELLDRGQVADGLQALSRLAASSSSGSFASSFPSFASVFPSTAPSALLLYTREATKRLLLPPHGTIACFEKAVRQSPCSSTVYFEYARFIDSLISARLEEETARPPALASPLGPSTSVASFPPRSAERGSRVEGDEKNSLTLPFLVCEAVRLYLRALACLSVSRGPSRSCPPSSSSLPAEVRNDHASLYHHHSIHRICALVFTFSTPSTFISPHTRLDRKTCETYAAHLSRLLTAEELEGSRVSLSLWFLALPQVACRCQHPLLGRDVCENLLAKLMAAFPWRTMWLLVNLSNSVAREKERRESMLRTLETIVHRAAEIQKRSSAACSTGGTVRVLDVYRVASVFVREFHRVAMDEAIRKEDALHANQRYAELYEMMQSLSDPTSLAAPLPRVALPTLANLRLSPGDVGDVESLVEILSLSPEMQVFPSKQRPKKVTVVGSDGRTYSFLVKNERHGDLRKDSRTMDLAENVNVLLAHDPACRAKNLRLRTFSVVTLSEVSGMIEWVEGLTTMRRCVSSLYSESVPDFAQRSTEFFRAFQRAQERHDHQECYRIFTHLGLGRLPPVMQRLFFHWFNEDPARWYRARQNYAHTLALWSIFGYIIGLGDRHGENILLDTADGSVMHVDFDCLLEKGRTLPVPEVVPFRLTQNLVSCLGVTGVEGPFKVAAVEAMDVARQNREILMSILMNFVYDPLIEWRQAGARHAQLQRKQGSKPGLSSHSLKEGWERIAYESLVEIDYKLRGGIGGSSRSLPPHFPSSFLSDMRAATGKRQQKTGKREGGEMDEKAQQGAPTFGSGNQGEQRERESEPTSEHIHNGGSTASLPVREQVHAVIDSAMKLHNLARMYVGWVPWL